MNARKQAAAERVWNLLYPLFQTRKEIFRAAAGELEVTPAQLHALLTLEAATGEPMRSLADRWQCDASNVTVVVDRLEACGLAERRLDPGDRRVRTVVLTPAGARARERVLARLRQPPPALLDLPLADLEAIEAMLDRVDTGPPLAWSAAFERPRARRGAPTQGSRLATGSGQGS